MLLYLDRPAKEKLFIELLRGGVSAKSACKLLDMRLPHGMYVLRQRGIKAVELKRLYPQKYASKERLSLALKLLKEGATAEEIFMLLGIRGSTLSDADFDMDQL